MRIYLLLSLLVGWSIADFRKGTTLADDPTFCRRIAHECHLHGENGAPGANGKAGAPGGSGLAGPPGPPGMSGIPTGCTLSFSSSACSGLGGTVVACTNNTTFDICDGEAANCTTTPLAPGNGFACNANGGSAIVCGLASSPVTIATVCNGVNGTDGTNGLNGTNGLSTTCIFGFVYPGSVCPTGGINATCTFNGTMTNGTLCHGSNGEAGPPGPSSPCTESVNVTHIIYVQSGGSDVAGNGTQCAPYATITYAMSTIPDGTNTTWVISVGPGTFDGNWTLKASVYVIGAAYGETMIGNGAGTIGADLTSFAAVPTFNAFAGFQELSFNDLVAFNLATLGSTTPPGAITIYFEHCSLPDNYALPTPSFTGRSTAGDTFHGENFFAQTYLEILDFTNVSIIDAEIEQVLYVFINNGLSASWVIRNTVFLNAAELFLSAGSSQVTVVLSGVTLNTEYGNGAGLLIGTSGGNMIIYADHVPIVGRVTPHADATYTIIPLTDAYSYGYTPGPSSVARKEYWNAPLVTVQNALDQLQYLQSRFFTPTVSVSNVCPDTSPIVANNCTYAVNGVIVNVWGSAYFTLNTTCDPTFNFNVTVYNPANYPMINPVSGLMPGSAGFWYANNTAPITFNSVIAYESATVTRLSYNFGESLQPANGNATISWSYSYVWA